MQIKSSKCVIKIKTQKSVRFEIRELIYPLEGAEICMELPSACPLTFADGSKVIRKSIKKISDSTWRKMTINFTFANVDDLISTSPQYIRFVSRDADGNKISNYLNMLISIV